MFLILKSVKTSCLKLYLYEALAVYSDFKSHIGAALTMGKGEIVSVSQNKNWIKKYHESLVGREDWHANSNIMDQDVSIITRI